MTGPDWIGVLRAQPMSRPRAQRALRAWMDIRPIVAGLSEGDTVLSLTSGLVSALDWVGAMVERWPGGDATVWTFTPSAADVAVLAWWLETGRLRRLRLVMDESGARTRDGEWAERLARMGDVARVGETHAKLAALRHPDAAVLLEGSANLARNHRVEHARLSWSDASVSFVEHFTDDAWPHLLPVAEGLADRPAVRRGTHAITGVSRAEGRRLEQVRGNLAGGNETFGDWQP